MRFTERRKRFRALLAGGRCIYPGSVYDPLSARIAEDLIFDRRRPGYDPLHAYIGLFENRLSTKAAKKERPAAVEERLKQRIVDGEFRRFVERVQDVGRVQSGGSVLETAGASSGYSGFSLTPRPSSGRRDVRATVSTPGSRPTSSTSRV